MNNGGMKKLAAALAVIACFAAALALVSLWEDQRDAELLALPDVVESAVATPAPAEDPGYEEDDGRIYVEGKAYIPRDELDVVLLLGVDKYEEDTSRESYNNNEQSDFILVLVMDRESETYTALHLNRDTMTEIPVLGVSGENAGSITAQLALAHTYGTGGKDSCRNAVTAVSNLLYGIGIDHYAAFTMDAVAKLNDLVGGVTVTVEDDLTSVSPELAQGAEVTLTGSLALSYVRARGGLADSSNIARMRRQKQYLTALREALDAAETDSEEFLLEAVGLVADYMTTDCTVDRLSELYERLRSYESLGIVSPEGEAVKGEVYMEFYPDEESLRDLVLGLFYTPAEEDR